MLKNTKIAVYCRVSSDEQAERGTIDNQVAFAQQYAGLHHLDIYDVYKDDGVTGTIPLQDRPVIHPIEDVGAVKLGYAGKHRQHKAAAGGRCIKRLTH